MTHNARLLLLLLSLSSFFSARAQSTLVYDNMTYDPRVQTILLSKAGVDDRYPIITLNTSEQLQLGFDILGNKNEYFQYTLVHCDAGWNPSPLQQNDYLRGMTFDNINDFRYSTNTYVKYVHYSLLLPNENMKIVIAGNYLLKVYRNFDEEDLVLTRRLMVINPSVTVADTKVQPATVAQYRFSKQEITFNVDYKGFNIVNPFGDVKVVIMQNGRWDNAITDIKPQFIQDQVLQYNSFEQALFNGGNEFRYFDIRSLRTLSPNVRSKILDSMYHVILNYDESRGSSQYVQYIDYDGRRVIANKDGNNVDVDGDYTLVNFYLMSMTELQDDVYAFGEFSDWKLLPKYKMTYNKNRMRYDLEALLKQGRYEYEYAVKSAGTQKPNEVPFEGTHANTENEYVILVYHRHLQYKYDELVGSKKFKTAF